MSIVVGRGKALAVLLYVEPPQRIEKLSSPDDVKAVVENAHGDPTTHSTELCHMTKAQLRALAKERGLGELKPTMLKAEMIELIEGE